MTRRAGMIVVSQEALREFMRLSKAGSSYAALKAAAQPLEDALAGCACGCAATPEPAVDLNAMAYVRLTPEGQQQLAAWYAAARQEVTPAVRHLMTPPQADADGVTAGPWHWLMHVFGPTCFNGTAFPFEGGAVYLNRAAVPLRPREV